MQRSPAEPSRCTGHGPRDASSWLATHRAARAGDLFVRRRSVVEGWLSCARCVMRQFAVAGLMATVGLAVGAPRLKDRPDKDQSVVGQWELVSLNGTEVRGFSQIETFLEDGTRIKLVRLRLNGPMESRTRYKTNT